jgi:hypothetical protein
MWAEATGNICSIEPAWNRAPEGACVASVSITAENPCSGCSTDLSALASTCRTVPPPTERGSPLPRGAPSVILSHMSLDLGSDRAQRALFRLGPMDGQEHPIESHTDELSIVMSDGQQHRYVRTDGIEHLPDGRLGVVFDWAGRYYGPK